MTTKLWTGRTAKQEIIAFSIAHCNYAGCLASYGVEHALDGAEQNEEGSLKRSMLAYWTAASCAVQDSILRAIRREVKKSDLLMGRKIQR